MGAEFLESEVIWFSDPLGTFALLNTEDGTETVEALETLEGGMEVGGDLGVDV